MSNFPSSFDDDTTLPFVNDNLTEIGAEAINAVRDAVFNIEQYLGLGADGTTGSVANRLGVSLNNDGTLKSSALTTLGLVTLPITNIQIANNAAILESKLKLDHKTSDLFNYIRDVVGDVNTALGWISGTGSKLEPHLLGLAYNHSLIDIIVNPNPSLYFKNKFRTFRDNTNSFTALNDLNSEFLYHQFADGYGTATSFVTTNSGATYPSTYAHLSSGIYLNTSGFTTIPETANDMQKFAEFIDSASIFLLGTRIQNLYSNGISRVSRSSLLNKDGYGQGIIPPTLATTYFLNGGASNSPVDDINFGDDIIRFNPTDTTYSFDAKFALVKAGDIVRVNYGTIEVSYLVQEKRYINNGTEKQYVIRINGRNLQHSTTALVSIDKPLFNWNKYNVLSVSAANCPDPLIQPSLIVGNPRGASALGLGFNPDLFDNKHYLLYLALYPTGNPADGYTILPAVDVTGNLGATPGKYTLSSIVEATNNNFRKAGFNYRFVAFQYQGEFGIALADSYNNAAFSILNGVVNSSGQYDYTATTAAFLNNVVGVVNDPALTPPASALTPPDPLGFGVKGSNVASPPYLTTYASAEASQYPTKVFVPLKRNNYYVNGVEREGFNTGDQLNWNQSIDGYGDGYWSAVLQAKTVGGGRVETTYRISVDINNAKIAVGKTLVVQSQGTGTLSNFGRFIIKSINSNCGGPTDYTDIVVYDAVHATGISPSTTLAVGSPVRLYFSDDSVGFNAETATDFNTPSTAGFKRNFEVFIDQNGSTFTHERGRVSLANSNITLNSGVTGASVVLRTSSQINELEIIKISSKLRGYQFGPVNKITLHIDSLNSSEFSGYLCYYDGTSYSRKGPLTSGRIGQVVRFYDETNIDYIDLVYDLSYSAGSFSNKDIDFQLFPTLSLDEEIMLLGVCQFNTSTNRVTQLRDERQFGNTSEKDLTTSVHNLMSLGEKLLHGNGIVRGFDLSTTVVNPNNGQIYLSGGLALVNGKFIQMNDATVNIPIVRERYSSANYNINWAVCVNDQGEYQPIPLLDYDPILVTPNAPTRLFSAVNPIVSTTSTYNLDASTFSNLINVRQDLTILYIVSSVVTGSAGTTAIVLSNISDARRYVTDVDNNFPLKFTSADSQGNFKSLESILNWLKYNSTYNGDAIVKGLAGSAGTISSVNPLSLLFSKPVVIDGKEDAELTFDVPVILNSNITFKNLTINFNNGVFFGVTSINNIKFENCNIIITPSVAIGNQIHFYIYNADNIKFIDCNITLNYVSLADPTTNPIGALIKLENVTNFEFDGCYVEVSEDPIPSSSYAGDIFVLVNSPGAKITNSTFYGGFIKFLGNLNSNNLLLQNLNIESTYQIVDSFIYQSSTTGFETVTYSITNLVNTGLGYLQYSVADNAVDGLIVDNCTFKFTPHTQNDVRISFINCQLNSNQSILRNVAITNCKFINNSSGNTEDLKPAISIINMATSPASGDYPQALLSNANISNNYCNKSQSIVLTTFINDNTFVIDYPGLVAENCIVKNNVCGTIGYWIARDSKSINLDTINLSQLTDKNSNLIIDGNTCHLITNLDYKGRYLAVVKASPTNTINKCAYSSGFISIINNKINWIHVGITYEQDSSLQILDNTLTAYNVLYLDRYNDDSANSISMGANNSYGYAIFVSSNIHGSSGSGNNSSCIIKGNTTLAGYWITTPGLAKTTYTYLGYIYCQSSNIISNNILKGSYTDAGIFVSGINNIITNNSIFRKYPGIDGAGPYVKFDNYEIPIWNGSDSTGVVTDNIFDSPYTNDTSLNEDVIDVNVLLYKWRCERNRNQTVTAKILPQSGQHTVSDDIFVNDYYYVPSLSNFKVYTDSSDPFYLKMFYNAISSLRRHSWRISLSDVLPNNVNIISVSLQGDRNLVGAISGTPTCYSDFRIENASYTDNSTTLNWISSSSGSISATFSEDKYKTSNKFLTPGSPQLIVRTFISISGITSIQINLSELQIKYRW